MRGFLVLILTTLLISCGVSKETNVVSIEQNYTMEKLSINENGFEGNIVVEVYDEEKSPLIEYQSILVADGKVIFDVPQNEHRCTFFKESKKVTIEVRKEGYKSVKTNLFSTDAELEYANFIKIILEKE